MYTHPLIFSCLKNRNSVLDNQREFQKLAKVLINMSIARQHKLMHRKLTISAMSVYRAKNIICSGFLFETSLRTLKNLVSAASLLDINFLLPWNYDIDKFKVGVTCACN